MTSRKTKNDVINYVVKVSNGTARVYNADTRSIVRQVGDAGKVASAVILGESAQVTLKDGGVRIYDIRTGSLKKVF